MWYRFAPFTTKTAPLRSAAVDGRYAANMFPTTIGENKMSGPARSGVLIYAKHLDRVSAFYERVLGAKVLLADNEHIVLQSPDAQLIIHCIPPEFANSIDITTPPTPRQSQAIKPFFTVKSLAVAEQAAEESGGVVWGPIWPGPGMRVRNISDPEGNIIHVRENAA
ncbi:MAG: hypothetical protein WBA20_19165 [Ketobacter sp.]